MKVKHVLDLSYEIIAFLIFEAFLIFDVSKFSGFIKPMDL